MHVSALMRRAPVRVLRITCRRLARRSLSAWRRKSRPREPVRTFSVPSGFSSARPSLTIALTATALLACSTAALGTLLTAGWSDPYPDLLGRTDVLAPVEQMETGALLPAAPEATPSDGAYSNPAPPAIQLRTAGLPPTSATPPSAMPQSPTSPSPTSQSPTSPSANPLASSEDSPALPSAPTAESNTGSLRTKPSSSPSDEPFAGVWATDGRACSPQLNRDGLLPALISAQGAWAGETTCSFRSSKQVGSTWTFAAVCSDTRRRWKTNVRMSVAGDRLIWASQRGSQAYVRCRQGLLEAQERKEPTSPV